MVQKREKSPPLKKGEEEKIYIWESRKEGDNHPSGGELILHAGKKGGEVATEREGGLLLRKLGRGGSAGFSLGGSFVWSKGGGELGKES